MVAWSGCERNLSQTCAFSSARRSSSSKSAERLARPGSPEELVFAGPQGGALRVARCG